MCVVQLAGIFSMLLFPSLMCDLNFEHLYVMTLCFYSLAFALTFSIF